MDINRRNIYRLCSHLRRRAEIKATGLSRLACCVVLLCGCYASGKAQDSALKADLDHALLGKTVVSKIVIKYKAIITTELGGRPIDSHCSIETVLFPDNQVQYETAWASEVNNNPSTVLQFESGTSFQVTKLDLKKDQVVLKLQSETGERAKLRVMLGKGWQSTFDLAGVKHEIGRALFVRDHLYGQEQWISKDSWTYEPEPRVSSWQASFHLGSSVAHGPGADVRISDVKYEIGGRGGFDYGFVKARIENAQDWSSLTGRFHLICWPVTRQLRDTSTVGVQEYLFTILRGHTFDIYTEPAHLDVATGALTPAVWPHGNSEPTFYVKSYTFEVLEGETPAALKLRQAAEAAKQAAEQAAEAARQAAEAKRQRAEQAAREAAAKRARLALAALPILDNGAAEVFPVAEDQGCLTDTIRAVSLGGLEGRKMLADLITYGCFFTVASGTRIKVQTGSSQYAFVVIADGWSQGKQGWVLRDWIRYPWKVK